MSFVVGAAQPAGRRRSGPAELDCAFESICESCTFFQTSIEFRPTLQAQHDDAATKHQTGRQQLFSQLLDTLGQDAS